jgi:fused signal recognition particle receptor
MTTMNEILLKVFTKIGIGSGNPQQDLLTFFIITAGVLFFLMIIAFNRFRAAQRQIDGTDRVDTVLGRLERIEQTVNDLRTETLRAFELLKADVDSIQGMVSTLPKKDPQTLIGTSDYIPEASQASSQKNQSWVLNSSSMHVPATEIEIEAPSSEPSSPATLTERLGKTRAGFFSKIKALFASKPIIDEAAVEELEAQLISSDLGVRTVASLIADVRSDVTKGSQIDEDILKGIFKQKLLSILEDKALLDPSILPNRRGDGPLVVLMVGVNGVGKTTTTAKLASLWKEQGARVLMVAADTFRAAAVDQLLEWGNRIGVPVVTGPAESKPSTVVFDAMTRSAKEEFDVVIIDTAGRLHTKSNLMQELEGIKNIIKRSQPDAPHETILVVDGSTGSNALSQAREFNEATPLTGLIVTKLDGTPRGGVVVAIKSEIGVPVRYIGVGEAPEDLRPFIARDFVDALFDASAPQELQEPSAHALTRRRRRVA